MALPTCECVTGMPIGEQLGHIYCALVQILANGGGGGGDEELDAYLASRVGIVEDYAGTTAPSGWVLSFGQALSRATYSALFAVIGTTYGAGDGSTTFNVPDCRGRVSAGQDDMGGTSANRLTGLSGGVNGDILGATGGIEAQALTASNMPPEIATSLNTGDVQSGSGATVVTGAGSTGDGTAHNNVQPTIIFNKIIYTGVA